MQKEYSLNNTPKHILKKWYYLLRLGRSLDEKAPNYLKQALGWS
jgi:2-oxoisovalerate dehydrogenase E1 component